MSPSDPQRSKPVRWWHGSFRFAEIVVGGLSLPLFAVALARLVGMYAIESKIDRLIPGWWLLFTVWFGLLLLPSDRNVTFAIIKRLALVVVAMNWITYYQLERYYQRHVVEEPERMRQEHQNTLASLEVVTMDERPRMHEGRLIGVDVDLTLRIRRPSSEARIQSDIEAALQVSGGNLFQSQYQFKVAQKVGPDTYRVSAGLLFAGLGYQPFGPGVGYNESSHAFDGALLCRQKLEPPQIAAMQGHDRKPVVLSFESRTTLTNFQRRYDHASFEIPLKMQYDHAAWMAAREYMQLEPCALRSFAPQHVEAGRAYLRGDAAVLEAAYCTPDPDLVTSLKSLGPPSRPLSQQAWLCIAPSNEGSILESISMLLQSEGPSENYCRYIAALRASGRQEALAILASRGGIAACPGDAAPAAKRR